MASEILSFIEAPLPDRLPDFQPVIPAMLAGKWREMCQEKKSGVKNEGNQTGADRTSFIRYGIQGRDLNKV
ncbi:hypothetical protein [Mesorhizobium sp. GbtcB19]|uniref:hypothetical protein n=1 Tax=Mesorhizobium sp. GbtcB19 TaxID=2824764 RepID=UPI001C30425D|nr:hypothetical protein [Mesorhizobium sp. GbtcB19]